MTSDQSPSQTIGPMYGFALCEEGMDRAVAPDDPHAVTVTGVLLDGDGEPIQHPDALIEVWQGEQFARCRTDAFGRWSVLVRKPAQVPPLPGGKAQAPHLNVTVWARGLMKQAQTRLYFPDEAARNADDPVLALVEADRRPLLVAERESDRVLRFDIRIQGPRETVFFDF
ncbi:MAG TPA: hypothetical protein VN238_06595 [Solirubrobacteraceae bacterium]|nr:hypothetical protein [Solirubrobacteraceae bacterium]